LISGDERPKQFVPLLGGRSLLRQTLERVARLIPRERTLVVTHRAQAGFLGGDLGGAPAPEVLLQPGDRGTAAAIIAAALWLRRRDRQATMAVFPSDHFVLEEETFMARVGEAAALVEGDRRWIALLGARPTSADTQYGWIEPGPLLGGTGPEGPRRVRRFWEKPPAEVAAQCLQAGCLWNTFVFVGTAETVQAAGGRAVPGLEQRLRRAEAWAGTEHEPWALRQAYALASPADFSRDVLELLPSPLSVVPLPQVLWSDLGTPARVIALLRQLGLQPPWLDEALRTA
jgi:mannose-1-phosphate guanylyltransferase